MMDNGFSKAVWSVVGVVVFAVFLWGILSPRLPTYTKEEAWRLACRHNLLQWHTELMTVHNRNRNKLIFDEGLEAFLEEFAASSKKGLSLSCPRASERAGEHSRYAIADFETFDEFMGTLEKEGSVVFMADRPGFHEGGGNVLIATMEDGELGFTVEWRPTK